jgi:hypothetical protein
MGGVQASLGGYDIAELEACTFFTRAEIIHLHKVYTKLTLRASKEETDRLELVEVLALKQLQFNPFGPRYALDCRRPQ